MKFIKSLKFIFALIAIVGTFGVLQGGIVHATPMMGAPHAQTTMSPDCSIDDCMHASEACVKHCFSKENDHHSEPVSVQKVVDGPVFIPAPVMLSYDSANEPTQISQSHFFPSTDRLLTVVKLE